MRSVSITVSLLLCLLVCAIGKLGAQQFGNPATAADASGNPSASRPASAIDNINYFNGHLNINIPLYTIGGRGEVGRTITLGIEHDWTLDELGAPIPMEDRNWLGYTFGRLEVAVASNQVLTSEGECQALDQDNHSFKAYTYIVWTKPDGTKVYLADKAYNGQPQNITVNLEDSNCAFSGVNRGRIFRSYDGSGLVFVAADDVTDGLTFALEGTLSLPDGTQYHVDTSATQIGRATDRNGNQITYSSSSTFSGVLFTATDSAGRTETFDLTEDLQNNTHDVIHYYGSGHTQQTVTVNYGFLSWPGVLSSGEHLNTLECLFPFAAGSSSTQYDRGVVTSVVLADGSTYTLHYNSYGEVTEVILPTGGKYKYIWPEAGIQAGACASYIHAAPIRRRVQKREEYSDATTLVSQTVFSAIPTSATSGVPSDCTTADSTCVTVDFKDGGGTLRRREIHQYYGDPTATPPTPNPVLDPIVYPVWKDGMEFQTDIYDTNGTTRLLRRQNSWKSRPCLSGAETCWIDDSAAATRRANDPQLCQSITTLGSAGSYTVTGYDTAVPFNRVTDFYEFDYGSTLPTAGTCPSSMPTTGYLRHTGTTYMDGDYTQVSTSARLVNLNQLPYQRKIDTGGSAVAGEQWNYDGGSLTAPTTALATGSHDDTDYGTGFSTRGNVTSHLVCVTAPCSSSGSWPSESFTYDTTGSVLTHVDFNTNTTSFAYGDAVHVGPTTVTFPTVGSYTGHQYYVYDADTLQITSATDEGGVVKSLSYDVMGRPLDIVRAPSSTPLASHTKSCYLTSISDTCTTPSLAGAKVVRTLQDQTTANDGAIKTETVADGLGRTIEAYQYEDSGSIAIKTTYDALGRIATVSNPYRSGETPVVTEYVYDGLGRSKSITAPDGTATTSAYSEAETTVTIPGDVTITKVSTTDAAGRLKTMTQGGETTSYTYDALDNLHTVEQTRTISGTPVTQTRTFEHDAMGRLTSATNPENGTTSYTYDANGNLLTRTNALGAVTYYCYDALNRPTARRYGAACSSSPDIAYAYDTATGRLISVTSAAAKNEITEYDGLGRITKSQQTMGSTEYKFVYEYNRADALTKETYPTDRQITTEYDLANRPKSVTGPSSKNYLSSMTYAPNSAPASYQYFNQLKRTQTYNNRLQPEQMKDVLNGGGTALLDLQYTWSASAHHNIGNPATIQIKTSPTPSATATTFNQSYAYDSSNRLATATEGSTTWSQTFGYDGFGNMSGSATGLSSVPALPVSGTFTTGNRRSTGSGIGTYDSNGNQFALGATGYDAENRLNETQDGASNIFDYSYDGLGQRVKKVQRNATGKTTTWVYDAFGNLAAEYRTAASAAPPCETCYLSWDHLGSTRMVTDGNGAVISRHDYLPFGYEIPATVGSRTSTWGALDYLAMKYTGQEHDSESALEYYKARQMSALQGRFMQADPANAGADPTNPQSWNMYSYVVNNPMAFTDPDGLASDPCPLSGERNGDPCKPPTPVAPPPPFSAQWCTANLQACEQRRNPSSVQEAPVVVAPISKQLSPTSPPKPSTNAKQWACTADATLNFALGFIPGYNGLQVIAGLAGFDVNPFQTGLRYNSLVTLGPTPADAAAGAASGYELYRESVFDVAGGDAAVKRLKDLTSRVDFAERSIAKQAAMLGKLESLQRLGKIASTAGTVANFLNGVSYGYDIWKCWNPQ